MKTLISRAAKTACLLLAVIFLGAAVTITFQQDAQVDAADPLENAKPFFDVRITETRPDEIDAQSVPDAHRQVSLAADGVKLDAYDVHNRGDMCAIALHFTPTVDSFDTRSVLMGTQLRTRDSGIALSSGGGSLSALLRTSDGSYAQTDPFVLWFVFGFGPGNWESLARHNGESIATDAQDLIVEIYLTNEGGVTFVGEGEPEGFESPHIQIVEVSHLERNES